MTSTTEQKAGLEMLMWFIEVKANDVSAQIVAREEHGTECSGNEKE